MFAVCSLAGALPQRQDHSLVEDVGNVVGRRAPLFHISGRWEGAGGGAGGGGGDEEGVPHLKRKENYTST